MTEREELEAGIRKLLATETHPIRLSNALFSPPDGLFCRIGMSLTPDERREIASGELFKAAQDRVHGLLWAESERRRAPVTSTSASSAAPAVAPAESVGV